jgi:hypothetical protein
MADSAQRPSCTEMEAGGTGCVSAMEALKAFSLCLSEADSNFSSSGVSNSTPLGTLKVLRLRQQLKQTKGPKSQWQHQSSAMEGLV